MMALVFDIETVGEDWGALDETTRDVLTRWIRKESRDEGEYEAGLEDLKNGLGFSPLTGFIVAIGALDTESGKGAVYYCAPGAKPKEAQERGIKLKPLEEKEMLEQFWKVAASVNEFVSFNGRSFDAPFLALRSLVHGVRPTKDLLSNRYLSLQRGCAHIDLQDQLTFYGAMRKRPSLHLFCRALGIESPKSDGVKGDDVAALYKAGEYERIARYNAGDLFATAALYERWKETLR